MINDIARNYGYLSADSAAVQIASHIKRFWAPSMIDQFLEHHDDSTEGLVPGAAEAVALLRDQAA
jgi:formate dehydrogenase subunit delta